MLEARKVKMSFLCTWKVLAVKRDYISRKDLSFITNNVFNNKIYIKSYVDLDELLGSSSLFVRYHFRRPLIHWTGDSSTEVQPIQIPFP